VRILVTGAAGFIGSEFVRQTLERHPQDRVRAFEKLTYAGNLAKLDAVVSNPRYEFLRGHIGDTTLIREAVAGSDASVNFAAETHVDRSILEPEAFVKTDVLGTWTLAEAARGAGVERFLHISTDEVYGAVLDGSSSESDRLQPSSPYSAAKAGGELLVLASYKTFGLPALIVRGANAYGSHQYPEKLIPLHITNAIDGQPLPVYGDGQQQRQWTHVADFAAGVDTVLRQDKLGEVYNVASPQVDSALPVNLELSRRWSFWDGLADTIAWYAGHEDWWRPIKSGSYTTYYEQNYADRSTFACSTANLTAT
jgi:dTDP-glucose 4,6-dehydratase